MTPRLIENIKTWLKDYKEMDDGPILISSLEMCDEAAEILESVLKELEDKRDGKK